MPRLLPALLVLALLGAGAAAAAPLRLEVITPRHLTAEELLAALRPLVPEPGTVSAAGGRVVIQAPAEHLEQLRRAVDAIDRPRRDLLITIAHGRHPPGTGSRTWYTRARPDERDHQRLRLREGAVAFVRTGREVPVGSRRLRISEYGLAAAEDAIEYRAADTGFYVRARLSGERVSVDVSAWRRRESLDAAGVFSSADVHTSVSTVLGEWVEIGGNLERPELDDTRRQRRTHARERGSRRIYLRVELAR